MTGIFCSGTTGSESDYESMTVKNLPMRSRRRSKDRRRSLLGVAACVYFTASIAFGGMLEKIQDPVVMKKYLECYIIPPASPVSVKEQMEAEGFKCSFRTDSTFKKHMSYLYCIREIERPQLVLWEIAFERSGTGMLTGEVAVIKTFLRKRTAPTASL